MDIKRVDESVVGWDSFGLDSRIQKAIQKLNWENPTLVQNSVIRMALEGKDIMVKARTGSGKTGAYLIPILEIVIGNRERRNPQSGTLALILVPTRELCEQVCDVIEKLTRYSQHLIHYLYLASDIPLDSQKHRLSELPDIIVATPGRVLSNLEKGHLKLNNLKVLVIDEADLIISYGCDNDIKKIANFLPKLCQGFLVSATLNSDVSVLRDIILHNCVVLRLEEQKRKDNLKQLYTKLNNNVSKFLFLYTIIKLKIVGGKIIIFANSVRECYKIKLFLEHFCINSAILNSNFPFNSRYHVVQEFNRNKFNILIATDESNFGEEDLPRKAKVKGNKANDTEEKDKSHIESNDKSNDIENDDNSNDIESNDKSNDIENDDNSNDIETDDNSNDIESNDIESNDNSNDIESNDNSNDIESNDNSNDIESNDNSTDIDKTKSKLKNSNDINDYSFKDSTPESCVKYIKNDADSYEITQDGENQVSKADFRNLQKQIQDLNKIISLKKKNHSCSEKEYSASRGVDFQNISAVINFELPNNVEDYIHRIGRTARCEKTGLALSLVVPEEHKILDNIIKSEGEKLKAYELPLSIMENFRYRVEDIMRYLNKSNLKKAEYDDLKREVLNSEQLKSYFGQHRKEYDLLKHDKPLTKHINENLRTLPPYLLPTKPLEPLFDNVTQDPKKDISNKSFRMKRRRCIDPLKSFEYKSCAKKKPKKEKPHYGMGTLKEKIS